MGKGWDKKQDSNLLGRKYIDKSMLKYGTVIPLNLSKKFLENILDGTVLLGQSKEISLIINNKKYSVIISNADRKNVNTDTFRILYSTNSELLEYLNKQFKHTANLIEIHGKVDTDEYIEFYKGEYLNEFICKLHTHKKSEAIDKEFIETIKSQKTNKSYKIALLSCFLQEDQMKSTITYDEIYNGLQRYYAVPNHRQDLSEEKELESWPKNKYISKMKETAIKNLPQEYFMLDNKNETYSLSDEISKYVTDTNFIREYKEAVEFLENKYFKEGEEDGLKKIKIMHKSKKDIVNNIHKYISSQGYDYNYEQISNLYLSLKTKPFVILAGISGTGKSKIVRLFANALGATTENNQYNMISVRPDWNDSTELIGYKNLESKFIKGRLTQIIEEAGGENLDKLYFICLDEMNLARVEYYLSDYLSVIESRRKENDFILTDSLIYDYEIEDNDTLKLPENLYVIGTVNMDDTTFQFSRKVLDRSNTIEFSDVNLENLFENEIEEVECISDVYNDFLKSNYLKTIDIEKEYRNYAKEINKKIIEINNILSKSQKQFAYRVRDEILFYMIENKKADLLQEDIAFDYQIMQKVLPAINGSENSIKEILVSLFNFICEKEILNDSDIYEAENYLKNNNVRYKRSAEKIVYMLKEYNYDGYASYWY